MVQANTNNDDYLLKMQADLKKHLEKVQENKEQQEKEKRETDARVQKTLENIASTEARVEKFKDDYRKNLNDLVHRTAHLMGVSLRPRARQ